MPIRSLLLGLIAVSAIVILGIFLQSLFAEKPAEQAAAPPPIEVLVANAALPHGRLLRPEDARWQIADHLPPDAVANAIVSQQAPVGQVDAHVLGDNLGAITRRDIAAGEVLITNDIVKPGDRDFLPAVLAPGARAITVSVNTLSGSSAGLIYPGDHVDVILTQTFHENNLPIGRRTAGETVAEDLRVLAIDHFTQGGTVANSNEPQMRNSARTVTLEANPALAVKIQIAADLGKLSLTLRSLDTSDTNLGATPKEDTTIWAEDTSKALGALSRVVKEAEPEKPKPEQAAAHQVMIIRGDAIGHGGAQN